MTTVDRAIADALTAAAQAQPSPTGRPEVVIAEILPESKAEQLLCLEDKLRAAKATAEANWEEFRSALTVELLRQYPGDAAPTKSFEIPGGPMWSALTLSWRDGKEYLPTDLIKQHIPQVWTAFKKKSKGYWELRRKGKS